MNYEMPDCGKQAASNGIFPLQILEKENC